MRLILLTVVLLSVTSLTYAIDSVKCSNMLNNGLWKKYKYGGMGEAYWNACTKGSKKDGTTRVTGDASTESSTTAVDTKYTSNVWTSQTQSTSSFGECSAFAQLEQLKKDRDVYIAQNENEVLIEIARGNGEHLKVITFYSGCTTDAYSELSSNLQKFISDEKTIPDPRTISSNVDKIISSSNFLRSQCLVSL